MTIGFLIVSFIGLNPMSGTSLEDRASGSPLDRMVMIAIFILAIPVLIHNRALALKCMRSNKLLLSIVAFSLLSALWSSFPGITIRRAAVLLMSVVIAMAVVVGETRPRRTHTLLFYFLTGTIFLNLVVMVLLPGRAWSSEGLQGLYPSKNIAGEIGMITAVIGIAWLRGTNNRTSIAIALFSVAIAFFFLFLTKSKTSLGIAVLGCGFYALMILGERLGVRFILLVICGASVVVLGLIGYMFYSNFDMTRMLAIFIPDTSFSGRNAIWEFAYDHAVDRVWLGHGYGAFWDVGPDNDPLNKLEPGTWLGDTEKGVINEAHNGYLDLWLNIGLPATALLVFAYLLGMMRDLRIFTDARSSDVAKSATLAAALMVLITLLSNFTESTLFFRGPPVFVLLVMTRFLSARVDETQTEAPRVQMQTAS